MSNQDSARYVSRLTRDTLALVLAGGRGSRLQELTRWRAKPAVPFGGDVHAVRSAHMRPMALATHTRQWASSSTALLLSCLPSRRFLSRATIELMAADRTVGTVDISRPPTSTGFGYGLGQWIDPSSPLIVSSPGAFGFTPWVDRVNQVAGIFLVDDLNTRVVDDINDIRAMVNVVTAGNKGVRLKPVLPANAAMPPAAKAPSQATRVLRVHAATAR